MFGRGRDAGTLHLVDFHLSRPWRTRALKYIKPPARALAADCVRIFFDPFESVNRHACGAVSRRDDLEALGHVLLYLARGNSLPWECRTPASSRHGTSAPKLCEYGLRELTIKRRTPLEDLAVSHPAAGHPAAALESLVPFLSYCRNLTFTAEPDYKHLRRLLTATFERHFPHDRGKLDMSAL